MTGTHDGDLARAIAEDIGAENKECWANALRGLACNASAEDELLYVEGWACGPELPIPMEHAWLERPDGTIVDPTPAYHNGREHAYFPAKRYTRAEAAKAAFDYGIQPFTTEGDQLMGLRFALWREAYLRAHVWGMGRAATEWLVSAIPNAYTDEDMAIIADAEERPDAA